MRTFLLALLSALPLLGASDARINGRWDITVTGEPKLRAWWLEVEGAGTPNVKGKFVGFPGGNMDEIQNISVHNGELRFTFDSEPRNGKGQPVHQVYTARLEGNKLVGDMRGGNRELKWIGVRAPEIKDKDDGSWKPAAPIELFDHKNLDGWKGVVPGQNLGWSVENGLLKSKGGANNLETEKKFWNFDLHVEYNVAPHSNSGIGLRGRYEVQILDDAGRPIDKHSNGALYSRIAPAVEASKPAGQWQTVDIHLVGRNVRIVLNGQKVVDGVIEGLTAIATDPNEAAPGPIVLQGDHGPVEFRSVRLTPLVKK